MPRWEEHWVMYTSGGFNNSFIIRIFTFQKKLGLLEAIRRIRGLMFSQKVMSGKRVFRNKREFK